MFLDAIGLVEYEDEISSLDRVSLSAWGIAERGVFIRAVCRSKYHLRRIGLKCPGDNHPLRVLGLA